MNHIKKQRRQKYITTCFQKRKELVCIESLLTRGPSRIMAFPGTDKGIRLELTSGAIEITLEQIEHQLELNFGDLTESDESEGD